MRLLLAAAVTVAAAAALASRSTPATSQPDYSGASWADAEEGAAPDPAVIADEPSQQPDTLETIMINLDPRNLVTANVPADLAQRNLRATLDTIAYCEGTAGTDGYRAMFGYRYFDSFDDHPRKYWPYTNQAGKQIFSSAAGRYQIIVATWDALRARLGLPDFSPASQDAAAVELIRERGALQDAYAGRIGAVANKCKGTWASLPDSNVDQPTRSLGAVIAAYQAAGGVLA